MDLQLITTRVVDLCVVWWLSYQPGKQGAQSLSDCIFILLDKTLYGSLYMTLAFEWDNGA